MRVAISVRKWRSSRAASAGSRSCSFTQCSALSRSTTLSSSAHQQVQRVGGIAAPHDERAGLVLLPREHPALALRLLHNLLHGTAETAVRLTADVAALEG